MKHLLLIGVSNALNTATSIATEQGIEFTSTTIEATTFFNFDPSELLQTHPPSTTEIFVAIDEYGFNFARLALIAKLGLVGYKFANLISHKAHIGSGTRLQGNVLIAANVSIAIGCTIGTGSWISQNSSVAEGTNIGRGVSLREQVAVGRKARIGTGSIIGAGAQVVDGAEVGRYCEWSLGGRLPQKLPDRSFFTPLLNTGARVYTFTTDITSLSASSSDD